jgi:RimJ/RimL family protein N-acetyltransferase
MASFPVVQTERLLLRRWREADLAPFAALNADPEVRAYLQGPVTRTQSDASAQIIEADLERRGWGLWAVEVVETAEFIGFVGLAEATFSAPFTPSVEVGWRLARPAWGHGYATEAARAALRFGFQEVELTEILSFTATINLRSRAVMERIGMQRDLNGDFDHPFVPKGDPLRPHVLYRLTAEAKAAFLFSSQEGTSVHPPG